MKLRKAKALLDLDDPLESSESSSDYEEFSCEESERLSDVLEEDEEDDLKEEEDNYEGTEARASCLAPSTAGRNDGLPVDDLVSDAANDSDQDEQDSSDAVHAAVNRFILLELLDDIDDGEEQNTESATVQTSPSPCGGEGSDTAPVSEHARRRRPRRPRRRRRNVRLPDASPQDPAEVVAADAHTDTEPLAGGPVDRTQTQVAPIEAPIPVPSISAECWLCYGEGCACATGDGMTRRACEGGGGADGGGGLDGDVTWDDELVAPCGVCAGSLRYIHRRCFRQWMEGSWAIACPNCRTLYDSSVLDAHTGSGPAMLLASCPPGTDLRQPLPPRTLVHFSVGGAVELSMAVGGITPGVLLHRIRHMVGDMAALGGDGGLGIVHSDGSALQLPNFDVTTLVLELGPTGPSEPRAGGANLPFAQAPNDFNRYPDFPDLISDNESDEYRMYGHSAFDDYDDDEEEGASGGESAFFLRTAPPPASHRENSFTSAAWDRQPNQPAYISGGLGLSDYLEDLRERAGPPPYTVGGMIGMPDLQLRPGRAGVDTRSAAEWAVVRADRRNRRRADQLLQQHTQQRYGGGGSMGGHGGMMPGPSQGGGRRR